MLLVIIIEREQPQWQPVTERTKLTLSDDELKRWKARTFRGVRRPLVV